MKWNGMFKLLGPLSKSIRQNPNGYSLILKNRTIFQFKDFSFEATSVDLAKDYIILINSGNIKKVSSDKWKEMKIYNI